MIARPDVDVSWMQRALDLAERGRATVSPNPLVGCVLVRDGEPVGEGWHERAGGPHAEIRALSAAGDRAHGATAYVTLEPCTHTGRTGPCAPALVAAGISRVVVALRDPNPRAAGGVEALRAEGVQVVTDVGVEAARRQNEVFLHGVVSGRPFVVLKAAVSLDGRIAAADATSRWLTGAAARRRAHELRAEVDAVLVGSGTVLADDPQLTVRLAGYGGPQPLRVVLDRRGRITSAHRVLDAQARTLVLGEALPDVFDRLWKEDVRSVLVEGGASVTSSVLRSGLWDRLVVHLAPILLGARGRPLVEGEWATTLSDAPRLRTVATEQVGGDVIIDLRPHPAEEER